MTAIVLLKPWKIWPIGHVIPDMPAGQASLLLGRGICEEVKAVQAPANRMMQSPITRGNQKKPTIKLRVPE